MGNSLSVRVRSVFQNSNEESWLSRVKDNARAFFDLRRVAMPGGAGAFDLLDAKPEPGARRRQAASALVHALVIGALLLLGRQAVDKLPPSYEIWGKDKPLLRWNPEVAARTQKAGGTNGSGGHLGELPPSAGDFAARSNVVVIHPRLPDHQEHALPVEPTIFDVTANDVRHVPQIGLPNMKERNDSNGPGKKVGMGFNGDGNTMGIGEDNGVGESGDGRPGSGAYPVKCVYCPDPEYTEEARKAKLQGTVTLRVLVSADGRAGRVKIIKGLGLGLDERAMDMVRQWRFEPARDAGRHAITEWVTVETTYRLF
ncbi:MAG TPA: energy transducer TonB [Candidatus Sulfotelmatobacter sp.]|jgi:protein TonB|nr:energy transducer TonB [Candidatus Sulfotelmatobacter sp.]